MSIEALPLPELSPQFWAIWKDIIDNQVELPADCKKVLYDHLWDLYS